MPEATLRVGSLVLYKGQPARVHQAGAKLEIELAGNEHRQVRAKDVQLLHPGPLGSLAELAPQAGEVQTAWELLAGTTTTLADLAELAYGAYTPVTAWAAWQLLADGLYFHGTPDAVVAHTAEEVAREQAARETQAVEARAWEAFRERVRARRTAPEDRRYLREVEEVAFGQKGQSRVLRRLGRSESPDSAHALLLSLEYWDHTVNPHPRRVGLSLSVPTERLPDLPSEDRADLTFLPAFAIDDEGNQEPDDALSLEGDRLWVHVADPAALVPADSAADLEARSRGASLYLPEGTVPMLPWRAVQALGLGLAERSPALSLGIDTNALGEVEGLEVVPSWVNVTRLTYQEAEARLAEQPFRQLLEVAQRYQVRRRAQGAVSIELPEVRIQVAAGAVTIHPLLPLHSRDLVTEAMLMAGEAVAQLAIQQRIPIPFTTQAPPWIEDRPRDLAGMYSLRRASQPSQPSSVPGPHAGLGLAAYAQATSPLRRYLDLVVHQQLRAHLRGEELLAPSQLLDRVGAAAAAIGSVRQAERLSRRHWTLVWLIEQPGWQGDGILVEKQGMRGTVLIPDLDLDAQVHLRHDPPLNSAVALTLRAVDLPTLAAQFQVSG